MGLLCVVERSRNRDSDMIHANECPPASEDVDDGDVQAKLASERIHGVLKELCASPH